MSWVSQARLFVLTLIGVGIVLNVVIGQIVRNVLKWAVYLDSIGTILAGALGGPLVGAATGALSNVVWGLIFNDPGIMPYALTAACIGACAAGAARLGAFKTIPTTLLAGLVTGAIAALVSAPITAYIQQGASGAGTIVLRELLTSTSDNLLQKVTFQGFVSDPLDKALSFLVVFGILQLLPESIRQRAAEARQVSRSNRLSARYGAAVLMSLVALSFAWVFRPAAPTCTASSIWRWCSARGTAGLARAFLPAVSVSSPTWRSSRRRSGPGWGRTIGCASSSSSRLRSSSRSLPTAS
ncbi:MAG TPA: hypothetical protein VFG86_21465, partial [Chloroflexota bacterium]|nr:hypothetical protein [Chloroflexota bacterium]